MKRLSFFFIAVFILSIGTYGQNTYTGTIFSQGGPIFSLDPDFPPVPCGVLWLETASGNYILRFDSHWICGKPLIVDGIEYGMDDEVEITGTVKSVGMDIYLEEHFELEIEVIKKRTSNIESVSFNNKIYYDGIKQIIVIDETLQNQSFTFELINMQGKTVCSKTNLSNNFIDVAKLSAGIYLYRLMQNNKAVYSDKIVLK